jgi:hypothetical protein
MAKNAAMEPPERGRPRQRPAGERGPRPLSPRSRGAIEHLVLGGHKSLATAAAASGVTKQWLGKLLKSAAGDRYRRELIVQSLKVASSRAPGVVAEVMDTSENRGERLELLYRTGRLSWPGGALAGDLVDVTPGAEEPRLVGAAREPFEGPAVADVGVAAVDVRPRWKVEADELAAREPQRIETAFDKARREADEREMRRRR